MTSCASVAPLSKRMKASARSSTSKALPDWAAASQVIGPQVLPITQVGLAPLQRAVRAHQPAENLREKARVQHDQAHALQHVAVPMASGSAPGSKAGGRAAVRRYPRPRSPWQPAQPLSHFSEDSQRSEITR